MTEPDRPWHTRPVVTGGSCSPFGGLRERKKAHTRESIIDAAIDLFERNGFDATTVEEIAAAADISPRTFFRYFESKIDVVMAEKGDDHPGIETLLLARPPTEGPVEAMHQVVRTELGQSLADASSLSAAAVPRRDDDTEPARAGVRAHPRAPGRHRGRLRGLGWARTPIRSSSTCSRPPSRRRRGRCSSDGSPKVPTRAGSCR